MLRPIVAVVAALFLVGLVTTQVGACTSDPEDLFDDATAAAIPVAERYVDLAIVRGDCEEAQKLVAKRAQLLDQGPATLLSWCVGQREDNRTRWRAQRGALNRSCPVLGERFEVVARYDCVRVRLDGRDCEGVLDGKPALRRPQAAASVMLRREEEGWRVAGIGRSAIGAAPVEPIRPCTRAEIRALNVVRSAP